MTLQTQLYFVLVLSTNIKHSCLALVFTGIVKEKWKGYRMKPENLRRWTITIRHLSDVPVSRNWYTTVSKLYALDSQVFPIPPFIFPLQSLLEKIPHYFLREACNLCMKLWPCFTEKMVKANSRIVFCATAYLGFFNLL